MNQQNQFTTQQEVENYKREQARRMATIHNPKEADERVTFKEVAGIMAVFILLTIVLPTLAGLITR